MTTRSFNRNRASQGLTPCLGIAKLALTGTLSISKLKMPPRLLTFSLVPLLPTGRRAVGFLEDKNDASLDAGAVFSGLRETLERTVRARFGYWLEGGAPNNKWFHGWNIPLYRQCFVFKWKEGRLDHRLYGFLCNPNAANLRFQLCALIYHGAKTKWKTDTAILDRVNALRLLPATMEAINLPSVL